MEIKVNYVPGMAATTAGNGSVSIDTPMGSGTNVPNLVLRYSCCQFCPFTDGQVYLSLPAKVKCTLTDEFHFCDDTHCDVREKTIPIEWLKNKRDELEKEYHDLFHIHTDEAKSNQLWVLNDLYAFKTVLRYWEKENE